MQIDGINVPAATTTSALSPAPIISKPRGRPKGSTKQSKRDFEALKIRFIDEVTVAHAALHDAKGDPQGRLSKGTIQRLMEEKRAELNLPYTVKISTSTVRNRRRNRKSLTPKHR